MFDRTLAVFSAIGNFVSNYQAEAVIRRGETAKTIADSGAGAGKMLGKFGMTKIALIGGAAVAGLAAAAYMFGGSGKRFQESDAALSPQDDLAMQQMMMQQQQLALQQQPQTMMGMAPVHGPIAERFRPTRAAGVNVSAPELMSADGSPVAQLGGR